MRIDGIESSPKLTSRRRVLVHIIVCKGCCCGVTEKRIMGNNSCLAELKTNLRVG